MTFCIYKEVTDYRISGYFPRGGMGGCGFTVYLNPDFANKAKQLSQSTINMVNVMAHASDYMLYPLEFIKKEADSLYKHLPGIEESGQHA